MKKLKTIRLRNNKTVTANSLEHHLRSTPLTQTNIFVADAEGKGRGVYTKESIAKDTLVEKANVIVMTEEDRNHLDQTLLHDYIFSWEPNGQEMCCMALGMVPMYNHSYASNCEYFMDYDKQEIFVVSMRDIEAGEELTFNYNGDWNNESPVWFEMHEMQ